MRWNNIRRQWGRVVLHWLIVTVAFGVISAVCMGLSILAVRLPGWLWSTEDATIVAAWNRFAGLQSVYEGLAYGLGMLLPVSLLSTLGTLSTCPCGPRPAPSCRRRPWTTPAASRSGAMPGRAAGREHQSGGHPSGRHEARDGGSVGAAERHFRRDSDEQPLVKD